MGTSNDSKVHVLTEQGVLNPRPERVVDEVFNKHEFFDPQDLVQVKYEMVRRVKVDGMTISEAAAAFGFSRPAFYQAQERLEKAGPGGLVPRKRGPRSAHKLDDEVVDFLLQLKEKEAASMRELADAVAQHFSIHVHPRSVERALARREKKRR